MEYQRYNYAKQNEFRQERWENNNGQYWTWMYRNDQNQSSVGDVLKLRLHFRLAEWSGLWPKEMCERAFTPLDLHRTMCLCRNSFTSTA